MEETEEPKGPPSAEASETAESEQAPRQADETPEAISSEESSPATPEPEQPPEPQIAPVSPPQPEKPALGWSAERPEEPVALPRRSLARSSRRDFLLFGAGAVAAGAGLWWLLPDETRRLHLTTRSRDWLDSLEARVGATTQRREAFLGRVLTFDDDVAEALYSLDRSVRTYRKSQITPLRNNYNGQTPDPSYVPGWALNVSGLASGRVERLRIGDLIGRFPHYEQTTRLICVEGWSAVAWWGGLRFADFLRAYPPAAGSRWAKLEASFNLDSNGDSDPYYVSIDLPTARHRQTLLATHWNGQPLPVEHGAPLRLMAPMKLGLKNIKAITSISYSREEPADYWAERGYSNYDGL